MEPLTSGHCVQKKKALNKSQEGSRSSVHRFNNHIELSIEYKI